MAHEIKYHVVPTRKFDGFDDDADDDGFQYHFYSCLSNPC